MAYIICKHCGTKMSDKSEACPVCGTPVEGAMSHELPNEVLSEQSEESEDQPIEQAVAPKSQKKIIAISSVVVILLIAIVTGLFVYFTHAGIYSSIYKPLNKYTINKYNKKYDDFSGFYYMVQQMTNASQKDKSAQTKYEKITYKRLTTYFYEVYSDLSIKIPVLSKTYVANWTVTGQAYDNSYLGRRREFQDSAVTQAIKQYEKQCRKPLWSRIIQKIKEWKQYIEDRKPENYLTIIPKYGYKEEGLIFIDYRPKYYFEIQEPKGILTDANIVYHIVDKQGNSFIEPQYLNLSELKCYDSEKNYRYFSDIDDKSFWDKYSIIVEIASVVKGSTIINMGDDAADIPEIVKNYLERPDYSNESLFIRQYIKADYPVYDYSIEDFVLAEMKKKDPLCFEILQKYSYAVMARSTLQKNACIEIIKDFYTHTDPQNRCKYLSHRLFNYTINKTENYLYNHNPELSMPATVDVKARFGVNNTYHVSFNGKYDDGDIVMIYENGNWKIDNYCTSSYGFTIDYSKEAH